MAVNVKHRRNLSAELTDRYPSPNIWRGGMNESFGFPIGFHNDNPGYYWHWFDDFHNVSLLETAAVDDEQTYASYIDTSNTIRAGTAEQNRGVLEMDTDATDNDGPVITMCGNIGNSVFISDTAGDKMPLWFEGRWKKSSIADNEAAMFLGLTEEARAIDDGVLTDDDGVLADIDHIGFNVAHDNGEELNFAYTKSGQTDVELLANMDTLAAATWVKTGFRYQPAAVAAKQIAVFLNNVEQTTYATAAQIATATFPDAEEMTFTAALKNGAGTATSLDLDWIRLAQEIVPD